MSDARDGYPPCTCSIAFGITPDKCGAKVHHALAKESAPIAGEGELTVLLRTSYTGIVRTSVPIIRAYVAERVKEATAELQAELPCGHSEYFDADVQHKCKTCGCLGSQHISGHGCGTCTCTEFIEGEELVSCAACDHIDMLKAGLAERVAQAFSDGAAQHEKVWGAALMNEIANLKAQQAERVKEAERQARLAELRARLDEASRWHQFTEGHDDDGWCCKRESELGDELMALEYAAPAKEK